MWANTSVGEFAPFVYGKGLPERQRNTTGTIPVFGSNGIVGYHDVALTDGPTVIIGRKGTVGAVHFSPGPCWPIDTTFYVTGRDSNLLRYAYYALKTLQLEGMNTDSAVPGLNRNSAHAKELHVPSELEQRAIAHILGTLDDKIELNRRMNETLEEMARALFKCWFVDFEPVRAKMEGRWRRGESLPGMPAELYDQFPDGMVDSELGEIPAGWGVKTLDSFGEIVTGKTPSTKEPTYFGDGLPFLRIPDMRGKMYALQTEMMLSALGADSQSKKTLPPGSISVSCIATPGLVTLNHRQTQTNQQINSIVPSKRVFSKYLYWYCEYLSPLIRTGGLGGTVFGNMNKKEFSALPALLPTLTAIQKFDHFVSPLHAMILSLEEQSWSLVQLRETLLPKLISGEVRFEQTNPLPIGVSLCQQQR